ncbi:E3 ubiquitin protein ligase RIE1 [Phytophthora cinnamomi]|uniref:E3 ubiquitin protein ligase RIE1 n=1 Tax=Phytophthora cinnamomi TaxID=4785 RepID=UPI00355A1E19|nr:E3 ubiquitin protein ligase RIE1 [Phytophthora cinnamomi]
MLAMETPLLRCNSPALGRGPPPFAGLPGGCGARVSGRQVVWWVLRLEVQRLWQDSPLAFSFLFERAAALPLLTLPPHSIICRGADTAPSPSAAISPSFSLDDSSSSSMDITVRVEVQYVAPEHALIRDVLQMFRTPAWVRFMVRYISPHLKNAAPADKSVMDSLSAWTVGQTRPGAKRTCQSGAKRPISSVSSASSACADDCVICLSELQSGGDEFVALPCGHQFHLPCIRSWLKLRSTCPSCRFQFRKAFSGSYAVRTLNSALLLKQEHRPLPKEEILNTCVGRETVRAVVNVTLSQIAAHAKQSQYPCVLNALMMHSNGDSFSEPAVADAALAKSSGDQERGGGGDDGSSEPRAKRLRVA